MAELQTRELGRQWLTETDFEINNIDADGNQIEVVFSGSGDPPPVPELGADFKSALESGFQLKLKVVPSQVLLYPEAASNRNQG